MKRYFLSILLIYINCHIALAQANLDSLQSIWNDNEISDSIRLVALREIIWKAYLFKQPDSAYYYAQKQYDHAKAKGLTNQMADALNTQGVSYAVRGKPEEAIRYYTESLSIRKKIGDKEGISNSYNNIGILYKQQGDYDKAINYYQKSLAIDKAIQNKEGEATSLNNIGLIYKSRGDLNKALEYFSKSLSIEEELDNTRRIAGILNNIGIIYKSLGDFPKTIEYYNRSLKLKERMGDKLGVSKTLNNIGIIYLQQKYYNKAEEYYQQSLNLKKEIQDKVGIGRTLYNLGNLYYQQGEYTKSIDYYKKSLENHESANNKNSIAQCYGSLGNVYMSLGQDKDAFENFKKALKISQQTGDKKVLIVALNNMGNYYFSLGQLELANSYLLKAYHHAEEARMLLQMRNVSNDLYRLYKSKGNSKEALKHYEFYIQSRDSILSVENQRELIRQEYQYRYQKQAIADSLENAKALQVQELIIESEKFKNTKQRQQTYLLYIGIAVLLIFLIFMLNAYRLAKKRKEIIQQQKRIVDISNDQLIARNNKIQNQADTIKQVNTEVKSINSTLEGQVLESTMKIDELNQRLSQYAFSNSHEVRGPLARILGLLNLYKNKKISDEEKDLLIEKIASSAFELDEILKNLTRLLNEENND